MISSAQRTEASAAWMCADSFLVMTVTESFGTAGSVLEGRKGRKAGKGRSGRKGRALDFRLRASGLAQLRRLQCPKSKAQSPESKAGASAEWRLLNCVEIHQRLVVIGDRPDFARSCL